jgi:hypothetical protein
VYWLGEEGEEFRGDSYIRWRRSFSKLRSALFVEFTDGK